MKHGYTILVGDVIEQLATLPENSVQCCVTSPPYWGLRDYGCDGQIGLESTPDAYVAKMVAVFGEVRRVLRDDGVVFLNIGDSYASSGRSDRKESPGVGAKQEMGAPGRSLEWEAGGGHNFSWYIPTSDGRIKPKDLCMIPWRVALALQSDGWYLRSVIVWAKKSPMPESVTDRPTSSWEPIFLLSKAATYFYDAEAVKEKSESTGGAAFGKVQQMDAAREAGQGARRYERPDYREIGRNQRNVWHLGPEPYPEAHFATFPTEIPRRAIKAGTSEKGCCSACGACWVRKREVDVSTDGRENAGERHGVGYAVSRLDARGKCPSGLVVASRTTGWEPGCSCRGAGVGVVPCVVLDPFLGSGTTVAVARELGRHGVGIELNPKYVELARDRIGKAERPSTHRTNKAEAGGLFA